MSEQILWSNVAKKGIIHKHVTQVLEVTNTAVIMAKEGEPTVRIPLIELTDVLVMNARSVGQSYSSGSSYGYRTRGYSGSSSRNSYRTGDVLFMKGNFCPLRFNGISDPNGLQRLVKNQIKQLRLMYKK